MRDFNWDGERIVETVKEEPKKHTPKDILNGLDNVRKQIDDMQNNEIKLKEQSIQNKKNLESAKEFEKQLKGFEEGCIEIQKKKILQIIGDVHEEIKNKAKIESDKEISQDPEAYDERQTKILPYLKYQKYLATHTKMQEKISNRMIRQFLYETPVFENPFK